MMPLVRRLMVSTKPKGYFPAQGRLFRAKALVSRSGVAI